MAIAIVLVVLQVFTPFPVVSWLGSAVARLVGRGPG
jgi:lauroyl/myristoyl acyltransferase